MASTLVQRLCNPADGQIKVPIHPFISGAMLVRKGQFTLAQLVTAFGLSGAEQTDVTTINSKVTAGTYSLNDVWMYLLICEGGYLTVTQTNNFLQL